MSSTGGAASWGIAVRRLLSLASYSIGRIAVGLGVPAQAIFWFRTAVRLHENRTQSLHWLAWALVQAGALDDAAATYSSVVKVRPDDARSWFGLARVQQDLGRHTDALAALDHAVALDHQNAVFHYSRGQSLIALGRNEEATSAYRLAVNIEPTYADAVGNLGAALGQLRRWDEAVRWHMEALRMAPSADAEYNLGVGLYELRRFDEAEQAFRRALQREPTSGELQARLASSLAAQGRIPAAVSMLEAALVSNPADPSVRATLSAILLSEGKTFEAIEIARDGVSLTPDPRGYTALGWAYLAADRETEALLAFDTASQLEPLSPEIDAARGCCFTRMGRHPEALQAFREVLARDPDYFDRDQMACSCFERSQREVRS